MSYEKHGFKSGDTLFASELAEMDEQIYTNEQEVEELKDAFTEQKGQAIYATDLLAPYPVPTFVRWDGNTKNTPFTDGMVLNQDGFAFVQGDGIFHTVIAFTQGADNTRYWLNHTIDNGVNRGWKNMTRELTEGTTLNDGWGMLNSFPYNTHILHRANNKDFSTWTEFVVQYPNEHNGASITESLMFDQVTNNVHNWYHVFGEHNKPNFTYVGNGSTAERTIFVGKVISYGIFIQSANGHVLLSGSGASVSGTNNFFIWPDNCGYRNDEQGNLYIWLKTADTRLNENGRTYSCTVL